ncbi:ImmA/IrrE family metallo-endopeptidase [Enemella evansiae]|uniref:ImmA/IrrE family metallo-endopeptidase n=1 Tax=Enemella evansiae TaxID=2016499 RepID=UPI00105C9CE0|nr:ImmA/IrrE family metallo-endopeptidase [Enemella evansiae]
MVEFVQKLGLRRLPDRFPTFTADPADDYEIEVFAQEVRAAAGISDDSVVGNATRAAERLGCLVIPMDDELGRHMGMSMVLDGVPVLRVARPRAGGGLPGDRQRFTVAHEIGHLALHCEQPAPASSHESKIVERQAHRFAGSFLAPAEALLAGLEELGGRVTLNTLAHLKQRWGLSIKALVVRFRQLNRIDDAHATSLYRQISARGWNTREPVEVGNEGAHWLTKTLSRQFQSSAAAAKRFGVDGEVVRAWTRWETDQTGEVIDLAARLPSESASQPVFGDEPADILSLPIRTRP